MSSALPPVPPPLAITLEDHDTTWVIRQVGDQAAYDNAYGEHTVLLTYWRGADLRRVAEQVQHDYIQEGWYTPPETPSRGWRLRFWLLWGLDDVVHWVLNKLPPYGEYQGWLDQLYVNRLDPFGGGSVTDAPVSPPTWPRWLRRRFDSWTTDPRRRLHSGAVIHEASHWLHEHIVEHTGSTP